MGRADTVDGGLKVVYHTVGLCSSFVGKYSKVITLAGKRSFSLSALC